MTDWVDLNRRDFLAALAATYGSAACSWAAPGNWFLEYARSDDAPPRERFVNTLCPMCPGGCGLNVRLVHGCAVGVRGNKNHPINRGGLCSRASAVLQDVYNPDRLERPLLRVGARGKGDFEPIGWEQAVRTAAEKLGELRKTGRPEALCVILGRDRGILNLSLKRFTHAYGSPNLIDAYPEDNLGVSPGVLATHGSRQRIGYDLANASYVLSFSSGWLDAHWSTEQAARGFAEFRRGRPGLRPRWIHADPRLSLTATKADEWILVRPGTEGTLALGMAHVILREGLYDREFIERRTRGFDDWVDARGREHLGFRRFVLQEYSPAAVREVTGVPEGTIFRVAREFSTARPAIALGFDGGGTLRQSAYTQVAIHSLNALVGSIDVPGGITVFQDVTLLDQPPELDETAENGLKAPRLDGPRSVRRLTDHAMDQVPDAIASARPYGVEAVILANADPVFDLPCGSRFAKALEDVPFVMAMTAYHNDTSRFADLVLPIAHSFQRWDFNVGHTLLGHPVVTAVQPIMNGPPNMKDPYSILQGLAQNIGGTVAECLPWSDSKAVVDAVLDELFQAGKGAAFGPANEESWAQLLESRGWRAPFADNPVDFKKDVLAGGGWTDPIYFHREWDRVFRSPPGKFAFSSDYLARSFEASPGQDGNQAIDRECLPQCPIERADVDDSYPLRLFVYPLPNLVAVATANLPWLNDIAGAYMFEKWRTWAEVHPDTAQELGLEENDRVEVQTKGGRLVLPIRLFAGLAPDVIAIPFGFGRQRGGRWCAGIGANPAELVAPRIDALTGTALWTETQVSVRKT